MRGLRLIVNHDKPKPRNVATTAGPSSDPETRGPRVIVQIIGSCPTCNADALYVSRTVGVVRYLKCRNCNATTKATPKAADVQTLTPI